MSLYAGLVFTVLGTIAWGSGQLCIFPSRGPTAFVHAFDRTMDRTEGCRIVGSHLLGGIAGLIAWGFVASGVRLLRYLRYSRLRAFV